MQIRLIDLNCKDRHYDFNLSVIAENDWNDFAHELVLIKGKKVKDLEISGIKVVVRDNKAKFKVFYQDSNYHELEIYMDAFGRVGHYDDEVSKIWQLYVTKYYGDDYKQELEEKCNVLNT